MASAFRSYAAVRLGRVASAFLSSGSLSAGLDSSPPKSCDRRTGIMRAIATVARRCPRAAILQYFLKR